MTVPKVMLLVHGVSDLEHVGEFFLWTLCRHYPAGKLCRFSLTSGEVGSASASWRGIPLAVARYSPGPQVYWLGRRFRKWMSLPAHQFARMICARRLAESVASFASAQKAELIWAVLNDPQVIYVVRRLAGLLHLPLVVTVWDPPERLAYEYNLDMFSRGWLLDEFATIMRTAVRCALASDGMQAEYKRRFGVESVVHIQGIDRRWRLPPARGFNEDGEMIIGFAGAMYANRELAALLSALSSVGWKIGDREVRVRLLGRSFSIQARGPMRIEYLGWRSVRETLDSMAQVDLLYVPYWFDADHALPARLCFPNKIPVCLASGRPLFIHAPKDSSPARFIERYPAGLCCHSLQESDIVHTLERFVTEPGLYQAAALAGQEALDKEFDLSIFLRRFAYLMGVDESELLPIDASDATQLR